MIDNSQLIRSRLKFDGGIFYYIQVLQRRKDNPSQSWMSKQRYSKFIKSYDDFDDSLEIAKIIADKYNARIYIDLSPGSLEKLTLYTLKELSTRVYNKAYSDIYKIFDKVVSLDKIKLSGEKKWMIDIDYKKGTEEVQNIVNYLKGNAYINLDGEIPTINGMHVIILPFNYIKAFKDLELLDDDRNYKLPSGETFGLKLDCNTLLYYGK